MKNIAFFITHKTLGLDHAKECFRSMAVQSNKTGRKFDALYIYNSHQDELSNNTIADLAYGYGLFEYFEEVCLFDYDPKTPKSLGADIFTIKEFCKKHYSPEDRVLLLKSDCVLSVNYFDTIFSLPEDRRIFFTAPFICAKERITNDEIRGYAERDYFIPSDDVTFFVENHVPQFGKNDFELGRPVKVTDEQIKFTSCYVITDYSCHFVSMGLLDLAEIINQSWGGVKWYGLLPYLQTTNQCFVIHKYHGIISENRSTDREGPVKEWLAS